MIDKYEELMRTISGGYRSVSTKSSRASEKHGINSAEYIAALSKEAKHEDDFILMLLSDGMR